MAGLAPLIGEVLGVKAAPIEYRSEGKRRSLRLGDVADAEIEGLPGQDGGDVTIGNHPFTAVPGFPAVVAKSEVLQLWRRDLIGWLDAPAHGFGSFQVAAIRTGGDPAGSGVVPALLSVLPRRGRTPCRARTFGRSRHRLEVGAALRPRNSTPIAPACCSSTTDEHAGYPPAIVRLKAEETLDENCRHRPVQYLNNVLEQDHRAIKRRVRASQHFRSFWGAWRTITGYEAIHMIRKGQACWSAAGAKIGLLHRLILGLFAATS